MSTARSTLNGTAVTVLTAGDTTYYITRHRPFTVLRIVGMADLKSFALDVRPLTAAAMAPVFASLRDDVSHLLNVRAPSVTVQPINGGLRIGPCDRSGCTAGTAALPSSYDTSIGPIRITMTVTFRATGRPPFTCSHSAPAIAGRNTTLSCRAGGRAWASWSRVVSGGTRIRGTMRLVATLNTADDVNALQRKLAQEQRGG